jgi:dephospho-CoA kinase
MVAKPIIVGLLGGVASGKSSVAECLVRRGALRIDADRIAHEVLESPEVVTRLRTWFGDGVLGEDGRPDRRRIGDIVFRDRTQLGRLEGLVHPRVRKRIRAAIDAAGDVPVVVLDAPLVLEGGLDRIADVLVFVVAPAEARVERARTHRGWEPGEVEAREEHQLSLSEKEKRAGHKIRNDGTLEDLDRRAGELWLEILAGRRTGCDEVQQGD